MQRHDDDYDADKTMIAFLFVPAVPAIIVDCYLFLAYTPRTFSDGFPAFILTFILAYVIAGAHVLVLGVPAFLLGKHLHAIRWWTCMITAFMIGGIPITLLTWRVSPPIGWQAVFLGWGLFGFSGGLVFWLLWRYWIHRREHTNT